MLLDYHPSLLVGSVSPLGIPSEEAFGTAQINRTINPTGLLSADAVGGNQIGMDASSSESNLRYQSNQGSPTVTRSTGEVAAFHGQYVIKMVSTNAGTSNMDLVITNGSLYGAPVEAGRQYTVMAAFRTASVARNCIVGMHWFTSGGAYLSSNSGGGTSGSDSTGSWLQCSSVVTAPVNAAYGTPNAIIQSVVGAGEVHYVDALGVFPGTEVASAWSMPSPSVNHSLPATAFNGIHNFGTLLTNDQALVEDTKATWFNYGSSGSVTYAGLGGLRLPGAAANYVSTPNTATTSITGDIDVRVKCSLDNWLTPGSYQGLISKDGSNTNSGWWLRVQPNSDQPGKLQFGWSNDGTNAYNTAYSTTTVPTTNGATLWVRATLDVDNGASGRDVKFYTSTDYNPITGSGTWTQLGSTVTQAGVTSIFNTTAGITIGLLHSSAHPPTGVFYYAEVRNGLNGVPVAVFDPTKAGITDTQTPTSFSVYPKNLLTTNQASIETDLTGWSGTATTRTRDTSEFYEGVASIKWVTTGGNPTINTTPFTQYPAVESQVFSFVGAVKAGTTNRSVQYKLNWYKADGVSWLGQSVQNVSAVTSGWTVGVVTAACPYQDAAYVVPSMTVPTAAVNDIFYADQFGLYDNTNVVTPTAWTPPGANWTVNGSSWSWTPAWNMAEAITLNGANGNYISTPDTAGISITGDIDIRVKVRADDWMSANSGAMLTKWAGGAGQRSYQLTMGAAAGGIQVQTSATGGAPYISSNTGGAVPPAGLVTWVRATVDVDDGAGNNVVTFYTSTDSANWVQLGSPVVNAGTTTIFDGSGALAIGVSDPEAGGTSNKFSGDIYYAEVRNGINGSVAASFDSTLVPVTGAQTPTTSTQGVVWTVNGTSWSWLPRGSRGSLAVTSNGSQGYGGIIHASTGATEVFGGTTYTAYMYMRAASTARNCYLQLDWYDKTGSYISSTFGGTVANVVGSWKRLSQTVTAPSTARSVTLIGIANSAPANETHYFDMFDLRFGSGSAWNPPQPMMRTASPMTGIAAIDAFGSEIIDQTSFMVGVASGEAFGTAQINQNLTTIGIPTSELFGGNSVYNPSFENSTTGWNLNVSGGVSVLSTAQQHSGASAVQLIKSPLSGYNSFLQTVIANRPRMSANTQFVYSVWYRPTAGADWDVTFRVQARDSGGSAIGTGYLNNWGVWASSDDPGPGRNYLGRSNPGTWQRFVRVADLPPINIYSLHLELFNDSNPTQAEFGFVDDFHVEPVTNVVTNPGFEFDTTGWSVVSGATINRDTSQFQVGIASARVAPAVSGDSHVVYSLAGTAQPNRLYYLSFWAKADVACQSAQNSTTATGWIGLQENAGAFRMIPGIATQSFTTSWQRFIIQGTAPADVDPNIRVVLRGGTAGGAAVNVYYDDVQVHLIPDYALSGPRVNYGVPGTGIASGEAFGTAQLNLTLYATSLPSDESIGNMLTPLEASNETDASAWANLFNATAAWSQAQALHGSSSIALTSSSASTMSGKPQPYPVAEPGRTYSVRASFRAATAGRTVLVSLNWRNSGMSIISSTSGSTTTDTTSGWVEVTAVGTAPAGTAFVGIETQINSPASGETHYVDQLGIYAGSVSAWTVGTQININATTVGVVSSELFGGNLLNLQESSFELGTAGVGISSASSAILTSTFGQTEQGVGLPGTGQDCISAPDSTAVSIVGDLDMRVKVTMPDWTPASARYLIGKYKATGNQRSWLLGAHSSGTLTLLISSDGTAVTTKGSTAHNFIDGSTQWVRVVVDVDNGASGYDVKFYTSADGVTWNQLGTTVTTGGVLTFFDGTAKVVAGGFDGNNTTEGLVGTVHYAEVRRGIDGEIVAAFDGRVPAISGVRTPATTTQALNRLTANQSSVETDTTGLVVDANCTIARSTAQAMHGTASLLATSLAPAGSYSPSTPSGVSGIPVTVGETYTAHASFRAGNPGSIRNCQVQINWYNAAGSYLSTNSSSTIPSSDTAWVSRTITAAAPANAVYAQVIARINSPASGGEITYVDQFGFYLGTVTTWSLGGAVTETAGGTPWTIEGSEWYWLTATEGVPFNQTRSLMAVWQSGTFGDRYLGIKVVPVRPNELYSIVAHVQVPRALVSAAHIAVAQFDSSVSFIGGTDDRTVVFSNPTTGWEKQAYTVVTAPNAAFLEVRISHGSGGGNLANDEPPIYIDAVGAYEAPSMIGTRTDTTFETVGSGPWNINFNCTKITVEKNTLRQPGISGNYVSTPDSAALSIAGDIDIRIKLSMDNWATGTFRPLFAKYGTGTPQRSYRFAIDAGNHLILSTSPDGSTVIGAGVTGTVAYSAGSTKWLRVTLDVDNGASGNTVAFYDSDDGVTWTTIQSITNGGTTSIFDSTSTVRVGADDDSNLMGAGNIYYAEVRNGINGTIVGYFDAAAAAPTTMRLPTSVVQGANTWTLTGSSWVWTFAYQGQRALAVQATTAANMGIYQGAGVVNRPKVIPGRDYVYTFRVLSPTARSVTYGLDWRDVAQNVLSSSGGSTSTSTSWTYVSVKVTAPPGADTATPTWNIVSPAAGEIHLLDTVEVVGYQGIGPASVVPLIQPAGIVSGEAFGTFTEVAIIAPTGIASGEAFGTAQLNLTLYMTGIASGEAFGTDVILLYIKPTAIASGEAFGTTNIIPLIKPTGIASSEAFGTAQINLNIKPTGIASGEAFGALAVGMIIFVPQSILTGEAFGTATILRGTVYLYPPSIYQGVIGSHTVQERVDWWSSSYVYRVPVKVTPVSTAPDGHPVQVELLGQSKMRDDFEDIEVLIYQPTKTPRWRRLARSTTTTTDMLAVRWMLDEPLDTYETATYYIYYGNPDADGSGRPVFEDVLWPISIEKDSVDLSYTDPTEHWLEGVTYIPGASVTLEFVGVDVRVVSTANPNGGYAEVQIDEGVWERVDLYWPIDVDTEVFQRNNLTPEAHKLRFRATGRAQPSALSASVNVVRMEYVAALTVEELPEEILNNLPWAIVGGGG